MKGYKGMSKRMLCNGMRYKIGKTYEYDGPIVPHESGYHFCEDIRQVFGYYPFGSTYTNRYFEIEADGEIAYDYFDIYVCSKITIIRELSAIEICRAFHEINNFMTCGAGYINWDNFRGGSGCGRNNFNWSDWDLGKNSTGYGVGFYRAHMNWSGVINPTTNSMEWCCTHGYGCHPYMGDGDGIYTIKCVLDYNDKELFNNKGEKTMKNTIFVCEYGWIIIGKKTRGSNESRTKLTDASVVRCWSNGKGIGGLAKEENKYEYTLDPIGAVNMHNSKVLFEIPCEW